MFSGSGSHLLKVRLVVFAPESKCMILDTGQFVCPHLCVCVNFLNMAT